MSESKGRKPGAASREAADWLTRQATGAMSPREQEQFTAWLSIDPGNLRAYQKMQRLWHDLGELPVAEVKPVESPQRAATRELRTLVWRGMPCPTSPRAGWLAGGALTAGLVVACALTLDVGQRIRADVATNVGEIHSVTLPDGSTAILNTNSAIRFHYTEAERDVELLAGEVDFTVAPDAARPFVVEAAGGHTRALGTEFVVRRLGGGSVSVTGVVHTVAVTYTNPGSGEVRTETVEPEQQIRYSPDTGLEAVKATNSNDIRAWTRGYLVFENQPLGAVIAELGRYYRGLIRITDPPLETIKVSGVFPLNDPVGVVDTLEASFAVHSTRLTNYLVLIHR